MKDLTKTFNKLITVAGVIVFFLIACGEKPEVEKKLSGMATANTEGKISFMYSRTKNSYPESCTFTTSLPSPNDNFVVSITSGESSATKIIEGLTSGQKVNWTATVAGKPLNHGSGNFVHIVND